MFSILIISAIGCFMLGHLYDTITLLTGHEILGFFNVGVLAKIGGFSFLFSASYAQMDGLVDDKSEKIKKYRVISLIAPFLIALLFLPIAFSEISLSQKVISAIVLLFISLSSYFNLKHLIIPDVSFGIIESIRLYNLFTLLFSFCYAIMIISNGLLLHKVSLVCDILLAIFYPCITYTMEKGRQRWIA